METEYNGYIPVVPSENEEFFDGYHSEFFTIIASLGIPSDLPNRNGNIYPSSVINKVNEDDLRRRHDIMASGILERLNAIPLADLLFAATSSDLQEEEEEFTKVNWKEEGF